VSFPAFTPSGNDYWTTSFYARLISGTGPGTLATDMADGQPSSTYTPSLVANTWVRIQQTGIPSNSSKGFIDILSDSTQNYVVDFWGVQVEPGRVATPLTETTGTAKTSKSNVITNSTNITTSYSIAPYGNTYWSTLPERFETTATGITANTGISISPNIVFSDTTEYTLEFWIKLSSGAGATYHTLCGQNGTQPWLSIFCNNTTGDSWYIRYRDVLGSYYDFPTLTTNLQTNWNHFVITAASSRVVTSYINGSLSSAVTPGSTEFTINRVAAGYNSGTGNFYSLQGAMALARIYARRLTADQIADSYKTDRIRFGLS
jgi:hypothetical protein